MARAACLAMTSVVFLGFLLAASEVNCLRRDAVFQAPKEYNCDSVSYDECPLYRQIVRSLVQCAVVCSRNALCLSFNFIKSTENRMGTCELNRNRTSTQSDLTQRENSVYREISSTQLWTTSPTSTETTSESTSATTAETTDSTTTSSTTVVTTTTTPGGWLFG